jgi:solute carrier family 25 protein 42
LWKGNTATMLRVFPYSGIQFMVFDRLKRHYLQLKSNHQSTPTTDSSAALQKSVKHGLTPLESLFSGMVAGTVSVMCTYPLDLTRAQLAVLKKQKHVANRGFAGVLTENYTRAGFHGLWRGIVPTILGILPYSGIAFALNEQGKIRVRLSWWFVRVLTGLILLLNFMSWLLDSTRLWSRRYND